jgi:guanylate cyclase soluble subunit beta
MGDYQVSRTHYLLDIIKLNLLDVFDKLFVYRKKAEVAMEGSFLVRQIYEDEITYNLITAAVEVLRK